MDRERLVNVLETVGSVKAAVFQMEQELLSLLSAEQVLHHARESQRGDTHDEWFTLAELAAWLKVSRTTVYRLIRDKRIPAYRVGRSPRIRRRDVERWLEDEGRSA